MWHIGSMHTKPHSRRTCLTHAQGTTNTAHSVGWASRPITVYWYLACMVGRDRRERDGNRFQWTNKSWGCESMFSLIYVVVYIQVAKEHCSLLEKASQACMPVRACVHSHTHKKSRSQNLLIWFKLAHRRKSVLLNISQDFFLLDCVSIFPCPLS